MAELIGAVAAGLHLAVFSFGAIIEASDLKSRIRNAPGQLQRWQDTAAWLTRLAENFEKNPRSLDFATQEVLRRCTDDTRSLQKLLDKLVVINKTGRFVKFKKIFDVVRKEKEVTRLVDSVTQRCKILSMLL